MPKGGGAIRGIGEKFAANPVTGTGSLSVPIFTSPGRSGFGPQLSLSYDSGSGNGPFGFGWNLSLPSIIRKTDKGLPKYQDFEESDVFILSGAEDLVPVFKKDSNGDWIHDQEGNLVFDEETRDEYIIRRYRPRVEGIFALIERWTKNEDDVHWRSISKDNILTIYGKDSNARIFDPENPTHIFSWLICETRDDKGNAVVYEYKSEDGTGIDLTKAHERNRGERQDEHRTANRYLKRIKYGNRVSLLYNEGHRPQRLSQTQIDNAGWMFEVVFDYEDHDPSSPKPGDSEAKDITGELIYPWKPRQDPFSSYRAGFEVRTSRLCQRVLMFHHFPGEEGVGADCLVRSTDFTYSYEKKPNDASNPIYSFLLSVKQTGYKRENESYYLSKSLPPVEFEYSKPIVNDTVEDVDSSDLENLPIGIDGGSYQLTDLHGEGIPGILTEQAGAWFYKRNLSPIPVKQEDGREQVKARFAPIETVTFKPNLALAGSAQFMDLAGDGLPDMVVLDGPTPGLYEHDDAESWQPFRSFSARLNHNTHNSNLKFVDLDGDGHADVLITENNAFVWHASLAEEGFGPAFRVVQALDEEKGPRLVFADGTESIYFADMSGDGLSDLVRIRNGEVCYWPNLGYCRFGAKVTMDLPSLSDLPPFFDNPDQFDNKRIRLTDIDGSGTTDIVYLHREGVLLYFNQSGNSWSVPYQLKVFPHLDDVTSIITADLLGNGTACLVWSSPLPDDTRQPMRYINLMGGFKPDLEAQQQERPVQKPHLLVTIKNNLGAETRVHYVPSTKFYLQDKLDGKPWITRLPFPVYVVERVETYDRVSLNRFVTFYAYHHGYFDGEEREFRGFGMVEQWDTEEIGTIPADQNSSLATNLGSASFVPPIHTRTWFHTGTYQEAGKISHHLAREYYGAPKETDVDFDQKWLAFEATLLPNTILPSGLTPSEELEACRSLKGAILRQEVYADDAPVGAPQEIVERANIPYIITEHDFAIETVQLRGSNRNAVFFTHSREALSYQYERNPDDPRIGHTMTLEVDKYGNVLKLVSIAYGRKQSPLAEQSDRDKQTKTLITYTENSVTNAIDNSAHPDDYRTPLPSEARTYELHADPDTNGYKPSGINGFFQSKDFVENIDGKLNLISSGEQEVKYESSLTKDMTRRLIENIRTLYRKDDLTGLLDLGKLESLALPGESYKLAFTPGLLSLVYLRNGQLLPPNAADVLEGAGEDKGGYVNLDGNGHWWVPSGQIFYSQKPSDTPAQELAYARSHFFLSHRYQDPFGQGTLVSYDSNDTNPQKNYNLLTVKTEDAVGNIVTNVNDYRVLQPIKITDPNGNRSEVQFDALGMVVGTAVMGKETGLTEGDSFATFNADLTLQEIKDYFDAADPQPLAIVHLGTATTRIIYDLDRVPACATTIAREAHVSDLNVQQTKVQLSFSYSDGFGREIQKKIQAEPGPVPKRDPDTGLIILDLNSQPEMTLESFSPRWVGSGWTIFNNKGKPVRQYEPFFTDTHRFEFDVRIGVSPVLFYDPLERVIATLHPNHTWEKVVFNPWHQRTYDVNDTVAVDPRIDTDVSGFVKEYFKQIALNPEDWKTWLQQRDIDPANPPQDTPGLDPEKKAAIRSLIHADTPSIAHFDTLGRTFLTVAHNLSQRNNTSTPLTIEEFYPTRIIFDIEGNQREVIDAKIDPVTQKGRVVMRYDYDMLGNKIHQSSMEAGERWILNDVTGRPIRVWDSRNHQFFTFYDRLRRPIKSYLRLGTDPKLLVGRTVYGDTQSDPEAKNLRGKVFQVFDQVGIVTSDYYDFKGNLLRSHRQLATDYINKLDWSALVALESEIFTSSTTFDALNRPIQIVAPHSNREGTKTNVIQPVYNEANLLEREDVWLEQNTEPDVLLDPTTATQHIVENIDYNAKGQRKLIKYGNGAETRYTYDSETFRLTHLYTRRGPTFSEDCDNSTPPPPRFFSPEEPPAGKLCGLQNLHYTYDPVGNIILIRDDAQQTIYFNGQVVKPDAEYRYDAIYRLIEAHGREHVGQATIPHTTWNDTGRVNLEHPNDGQKMRNYFEFYEYDEVGNIMKTDHKAHNGNWIRSYEYNEKSQTEEGRKSNRLSRTVIHPNGGQLIAEAYAYDDHGNIIDMPHLANHPDDSPNMYWNYMDQLRQVDLAGVGGTAYYVYDAAGKRLRKVVEKPSESTEERIYIGDYEVFRKRNGTGMVTLERETMHVMDDKQRIALVETRTLDTAGDDQAPRQLIRYQFGNHLGSSNVELDHQAHIISYEEYYPYGSTSYQVVHTETPKQYRYTGKERDEETGLNYHGARFYSPWLGRWISYDPGNLQPFMRAFISSYAAFALNPVRYNDPDGAQPSRWERALEKIRRFTFVLGSVIANDPKTPIPPPFEPNGPVGKTGLTPEPGEVSPDKPTAGGSSSPPEKLRLEPDPPGSVQGKRLVTADDLHANRNLGNAGAVPEKRLVTAQDLHANRNLGNAPAVETIKPGGGGSAGAKKFEQNLIHGTGSAEIRMARAERIALRAGSILEGALLPTPAEAVILLFQTFAEGYGGARDVIISRESVSGFAHGYSAGLLGMSPDWVRKKFEYHSANQSVSSIFGGNTGLAESTFNEYLGQGYRFGRSLSNVKRAASDAYIKENAVRSLASSLVPTVQLLFSAAAEKAKAQAEAERKKQWLESGCIGMKC